MGKIYKSYIPREVISNGFIFTHNGVEVDDDGFLVEVLGPWYTGTEEAQVIVYGVEGINKTAFIYNGESVTIEKYRLLTEKYPYWVRKMDLKDVSSLKRYELLSAKAIEVYNTLIKLEAKDKKLRN